MMNPPTRKPLPFDLPAAYQIVVQGRVAPDMSDLLGGMTLHVISGEAGSPATILSGELSDQAALSGVLNLLYELQLTVISVKRLD